MEAYGWLPAVQSVQPYVHSLEAYDLLFALHLVEAVYFLSITTGSLQCILWRTTCTLWRHTT